MILSRRYTPFFWALALSLGLASSLSAQNPKPEVITLDNPSFEDRPKAGDSPQGWFDCGHEGETPPDVQPFGGFNVTRPAYDGSTYIGLVARDNKTWEGVGQKLIKPILKGVTYKFSIALCKSMRYDSPTQKDRFRLTSFDKGLTLRVWAGNKLCDRAELLYQTEVVDHAEWKTYNMEFKAEKGNYSFIFLEAYYKTPTLFFYNGNILVDNASDIVPKEVPEVAVVNREPKPKPNEPKEPNRQPEPETSKVKPNPIPTVAAVEENKGNFDPAIRSKDLKVGQTFRLQKLYFKADSTNVDRQAEQTLAELVTFMRNNPGVSIEIGGHTNGIPPHEYCDRLSSERARNVASFTISKGIDRQRVEHKGYGKRKPVASDDTRAGQERNQRVEIKITQIQE